MAPGCQSLVAAVAAQPQTLLKQRGEPVSKDRGRRIDRHEQGPKDRNLWLLLEAEQTLRVILIAVCAAAIVTELLAAPPPMALACELYALAAVLNSLPGPKGPPPCSPQPV